MQIDIFKVQAIHAGASAATLTAALQAIDGVAAVDISHPEGRTTVKYDDTLASRASIDLAVAAAGFMLVPKASCCGGCGG
ncbi:MAG: heavy-metal-associated domain-containing protein [Pseudomonadota bacterium]|nr:heavy-metal-associated domain-containing protein [Pseudomonadota bacterium]